MTTSSIDHLDFALPPARTPVPAAERDRLLAEPGFGQIFTDHMVTARWSHDIGWHDGRLEPYGPITLQPATSVLHYAQEIFEGLKAFRQVNGQIVAFRPDANAARFMVSATRMAMPVFPEAAFVQASDLLVGQDHAWVPASQNQSLYLRPFMIATDPCLGLSRPSRTFLFALIASPAGAYGGGFAAQQQATDNGCDQVVWLDPVEHRWVEEMGGMNLFFVYGSGASARIMTPGLTGSLLPGIPRDSLLQIAPGLGIGASEGRISVEDWQAGCESGEITEVFACGTAAVVTPVGLAKGRASSWTIGDGQTPGPVTMQLRDHLLGIQFGQIADQHGWVHKIL